MSAVIESGRQQGDLAIRPLQPTIGAEIEGVDLRYPLSDAARDQIRAAILRYKVVLLPRPGPRPDQHAAFARQFGPLYTHPSVRKSYADQVPAIHQISAADARAHQKAATAQDRPAGPARRRRTGIRITAIPAGGSSRPGARRSARSRCPRSAATRSGWTPAWPTKRSPTTPGSASRACFVTHDYRAALASSGHDYPIVAHPVVRTHRETGQKILWVNFSQHPWIVGLGPRREPRAAVHRARPVP